MTEYKKTRHTLPQEVVATFERIGENTETRNLYIAALRRVGWTLSSISDVTGITRERVRQIEQNAPEDLEVPSNVHLPMPPKKVVREPRTYVEPDPVKLERLMELQPLAQQNRHNSEEFRQAAEDYTALVWEVHDKDGVPLYRLAKRLGLSHGALRFRLARYGYKLPQKTGVSKVYTRIDPDHRVKPRINSAS